MEEGQQGGAEDVVGPRTPEALVVLPEDGHQLVGDHLAQVLIRAVEDVEAHRPVAQRRIDQDDPIPLAVGNAFEEVADQVALGVNHGDPAAGQDVVEGEVQDQGALAAAGRPTDVDVLAAVGLGDQDRRRRRPLAQTEHLSRGRADPGRRQADGRDLESLGGNRKVEERGQLIRDEHVASGRRRSA